MNRRSSFRSHAARAIVAMALVATPALAHDNPPYDPPHPGWKDGPPRPAPHSRAMNPEARDAWLADCRQRLSISDRRRHREHDTDRPDQCETYLDYYYSYYGGAGPAPAPGPGYGYHGYRYASPCCQPMAMAPVMRVPAGEPKCTETVEYEYVDVPAPPRPRPAPDKRIKVVPDKRIKIAPDKRIPLK